VEVELREDPLAGEDVKGPGDAVQLAVVIASRPRLDARVDDPEPHAVQARPGEEARVGRIEAGRERVVGGRL